MKLRIPARLWILAAVSGILQVLSFPIAGPVPVWRSELCWLALTPLLFALVDTQRLRVMQGAMLGYAAGFIWYFGNCYWIYRTMHIYGHLPQVVSAGILVLFSMYLGLYHALFGALVALIYRWKGRRYALIASPFLWVAVELARAHITGLPWDLLGVAQIESALLTQLAPWTGVYGISFVIAAVNMIWLLRIQVERRRWTMTLLIAGAVLFAGSYGLLARYMLHRRAPRPTARAILLQENLEVGAAADALPPEDPSEMLSSFLRLSAHPSRTYLAGMPEQASTPLMAIVDEPVDSPALIAWPESPAPFEYHDPGLRSALSSVAQQEHAPLIVGTTSIDPIPNDPAHHIYYNSAAYISPDGTFAGRYNKMHLVPFGEYTPYKSLFFFAGSLLQEVGIFTPGADRTTFDTSGHRIGTFICYESIFGDEIRELANSGADVLVNISDDGWYGDTSAPWQHLNMVRMRAIENRRWVLRSTNTGITAVIDPDGRVTQSLPRHRRAALDAHFGYVEGKTFYTRFGDVFAWTCVLLSVLACGAAFRFTRESMAVK